MKKLTSVFVFVLCAALLCLGQTAQRQRTTASSSTGAASEVSVAAQLTGLYRIDPARSDQLYSVVAGAQSNLPFGEQQKFFIDLTVRLTPPDLLAIERRGRRIALASSRAPRIDFDADGISHSERGGDGQIVRTLAALRPNGLAVSVSGQSEDKFNVTFEPIDGGRSLRVTRRLSNEQLTQPVLIKSVYEKISGTPQWDIYDAPPRRRDLPPAARPPIASASDPATPSRAIERDQAAALRRALDDWLAATNERDIERQMTFYPPVLSAFYLARNVTRAAVRAEKERVFSRARTIDVRAEAPELIFQEAGRTAVMRFRKSYAIAGGGRNRSGEVVQELRWRLTPQGWKIYSERDVRVIR
ncbi:MAG TPA: nuclear transport factor 2 family protein [Pyrinomonadaceae bacterium]|nr:nuclear transport factor 2 family protein [Pyrinomonadaceae bacterium]